MRILFSLQRLTIGAAGRKQEYESQTAQPEVSRKSPERGLCQNMHESGTGARTIFNRIDEVLRAKFGKAFNLTPNGKSSNVSWLPRVADKIPSLSGVAD